MRPISDASYARQALVTLLLMAVFIQPLSGALTVPALWQLDVGSDTQSIWSNYRSMSGIDVAFIGDSRVRQDVDVAGVSRQLTLGAGHRVTVAKIGLSNADPALLDAAIYRALHLSRKPGTIVLAVSEFGFNANYQPDRTDDYWQMSSPPDIGFMRLALDHDWNRTRLVQGWAVPLVANWPIIAAGIECDVRPNPSCTYAAAHVHADRMTQEQYDVVRGYYDDLYLSNFRFSKTEFDDLTAAAERIRSAGVRLALVILPINGIAELNPHLYTEFLSRMRSASEEIHAPLTDLHSALSATDWSLWVDPGHLDDKGATMLATELAQVAEAAS